MPSLLRNIAALSLRAGLGTVDASKRTVDVVWTTGAKVLRNGWDGPYYEELSLDPTHVRLDRLNNGAPFLANHDAYDVSRTLGVVESARLESGKGVATIRFAKAEDDPEADKVFRKIKDGIIQNVSVGYRTYKAEKVDGGDPKVPTFRSTSWEPFEISAVAIGADDGAGFRSAAPENQCEIISHEERKMDPEELKKLEEARRAEDLKRQADLDAANASSAKAERERIGTIQSACRSLKLPVEFAQKLVDGGVTVDKAREAMLNELATRSEQYNPQTHHDGSGAPAVGGETDRQKRMRGMEAGMIARAGVQSLLVAAAGSKLDGVSDLFREFNPKESGGEYRGMSLVDIARECLEWSGKSTRGMGRERLIGEAFTFRAGEATTSDFGVLLENVMYKTLLGAYAQASDTWRQFCGTDSVQDFRGANRYRTGGFGVLDVVGEGGEYKNKSIPDGVKFQITTEKRGNMIALSREAIINDDLGALTDVTSKFGRAAGLSIEKAVYDLLAQNGGLGPTITVGSTTQTLFHASFGNVGTGAALSMAALEADRVKMAQQQDISNNEYLNLRPAVLLIPLSLEGEANVLNRAKFDPTASSAFEKPNIVGGLFQSVVGSPRLSGTRRYLFTNPGEVAAIKVVFLNGAQAPFMEQQQGWRVDGQEWKLRLEVKAQAFDPKGALTNAGV